MVHRFGVYDITLYDECILDERGIKYHILVIKRYNSDLGLLRTQRLYVNDNSYIKIQQGLKKKKVIKVLMNISELSRIEYDDNSILTVYNKEEIKHEGK